MSAPRPPLVAWPGWPLLRFTLLLGSAQVLWFILIYGGTNWVTSQHSYRVRLHLDADLAVPFVPAAVLGYLSIYPLFWLAPFILRSRGQIIALNTTMAAVTLAAGVCFLICPGEAAFHDTEEMGPWTGLVSFARQVALTWNFMPSLHVALSGVCVLAYVERAGALGKVVLWTWSAIISISTLLLHQHYVVDVITGYLLAWAGARWGRWR
jgi:membrane-associated phospholipid phosphatase